MNNVNYQKILLEMTYMRRINKMLALLLALTVFIGVCSVNTFALTIDDDELEIMVHDQPFYKMGDVNMDRQLDVTDAKQLSMYIVALAEFDNNQIKLCDVNCDGAVNVRDLVYTQKMIAGITEHKFSDIKY